MTHLKIEQNTTGTEEVNKNIISKLYELASSGDLDNTSDLKGRLHATVAYKSQVDYLTEQFEDLTITTDDRYIDFVSKSIERNLAAAYGDGTGVYYNNRASITQFQKNTHTETIGGRIFTFNFPNDECAFVNDQTLTTINELSLFINLKEIKDSCFAYSSLSSIDLTNFETIGAQAFGHCSNLSGIINLPKLKMFRDRTINVSGFHTEGWQFGECPLITEINIGEDVSAGNKIEAIPPNFARNDTSLTKVTGLSEVTNIRYNAFLGTTSLQQLDTTNALTSVGSNAFDGSNISCIDLSNVVSISQQAFRNCTNLLNISTSDPSQIQNQSLDVCLPDLTSIGYGAFYGCNKITSVSNLGQITELSTTAFYNCNQLTSYTLPSTLKTFNCSSFSKTQVETLIGNNGLETMVLGDFASTNNRLKYVEVPASVTNMEYFFHKSLTTGDITYPANTCICVVKATTPPALRYYNNESYATGSGATKFMGIYVPDSSLSAYQSATGAWQNTNIQEKLKPISQLQTDSPTYWSVYQSGLSNS